MSKKKIQFASSKKVVGVRWPSGSVTYVQGCAPLTARAVRKILPRSSIKRLKQAHGRGTAGCVSEVFIVPVGWDHWNYGL